MWETVSAYVGLITIFFAALYVMHRELVRVIKNQMPETMPQRLQEEVLTAYRKINGEVCLCIFGASASLCSVLAMYLQWRNGKQMTFLVICTAVFFFYIFLLSMKYLARDKGMNFLKAYNRAIELNQLSQLEGTVLSIEIRSLRMHIIKFSSFIDGAWQEVCLKLDDRYYDRYSSLLKGDKIRVFFEKVDPEDWVIRHIVSAC